jgi:hypothetical protein
MSRLVLDLSVYDEIDLAEWVEQRDLWGVVLKVGGNEGGRYRDRKFESHYADAKAQGLRIGAYYYTTATDPSTAREDALHCLSLLDGKDMTLPAYIDVEDPAQLALDMDSMTAMVEAFCETIEGSGHEAGIYSGSQGFALMDDSVCRYNLWLAYWADSRPSWATPERGYTMWQQGGMRIDGHVVYGDAPEHHDFDWWYGEEGGTDMTIRDRIVELAKSQIGSWYYSMNYSAEDGWGGMGTHEIGEGWGCAQHGSYPYNVLLKTHYVGSCWNFAGDALGQSVNQGGDEWEFTDEPLPGDIVLYIKTGHDGRDYDDYAHAGVYIGDGRAVSALGQGTPYDSNYRGDPDQGWGIQEHSLDYCFRWGTLDDYRFIRCKRLDDMPKPEPKPEPEIEEETTMQCMIQCDDKIYYWDGSPECVPYHVSPSEKAAIEEAHKKVTGKDLVTISMARDRLNALVGMGKARKQWREQPILDAIKAAKDAVIAKVEELLGKVE